jgi:hypothetical protein
VTLIMPPQAQRHLLSTVARGISSAVSKIDGGAHGAGMSGTQGIGVRTPKAAAVAVMTSGLAGLLHMPNGGIFMIGTIWTIVAAANASLTTGAAGNSSAMNTLGVNPKLQVSAQPVVNSSGIEGSFALRYGERRSF